jgi:uncharacterized FlaG/YvyC family protein
MLTKQTEKSTAETKEALTKEIQRSREEINDLKVSMQLITKSLEKRIHFEVQDLKGSMKPLEE